MLLKVLSKELLLSAFVFEYAFIFSSFKDESFFSNYSFIYDV